MLLALILHLFQQIGGKFEELRGIIDQVQDKSRVGVCLDTCHAFAAGYDIASERGFEIMMDEFETIVGLKYLRGVHLNDFTNVKVLMVNVVMIYSPVVTPVRAKVN